MSRKEARSPYEQGELASSSPENFPHSDNEEEEHRLSLSPHSKEGIDEEEEEEDIDEKEEEEEDMEEEEQNEQETNHSGDKQSGDDEQDFDDSDSLDIKPPQAPAAKKEKSSKHRHREDRHRERGREHGNETSRERERAREKDKMRDKERVHERPYDHKSTSAHDRREVKERERRVSEEDLREEEKREKSRRERERLERLERERQRERTVREERERKEIEKRKRKEEKRKEEERLNSQTRTEEKYHRSKERHSRPCRSRSRSRERRHSYHSEEKRDEKPRSRKHTEVQTTNLSSSQRERERGLLKEERNMEVDEEEEVQYHEEEEEVHDEEAEEEDEEEEVEQSGSEEEEEESEDSDSDSESGSNGKSESSGSSSSSKHSESAQPEEVEEDEVEEEEEEKLKKRQLKDIKSKFDDQSDPESLSQSPQQSEHDGLGYIEDTPPESPIELKPQLPPYLPAIQGCRNVEEFHCLNRIEEGTYGVVYRAKDKKTDEIVALKRLKMEKEKEGFPITSLREINTLLKAQHKNIVTVREIVVGSNMDKIYIVMDYVEHDLKSLMETMKQPFLVGEVKTLMMQLLSGVIHLHDNWIIHRDLKTSNLLLSHKGILKIGDFGLAREYGSPLKNYTPIVVTLWYRAPELILGVKEYSTAVDMWSVGCIYAEFLIMKALWQGKSEIDQLQRIFKDLGTPTEKIWPGVSNLSGMKKCTFTEYPYNTLRNKFGSYLTDLGFDLMNRFLTYSPGKRISAEEALKHEYFKEAPLPVDPSMFPTWPAKSEQPRRHASSPKPPSGGKAYAKLLAGDDDDTLASGGFHLTNAAKGVSAVGPGFSLKF
ncbi:hypothetical protein ACJMK2_007622 [Sinanodonta woodiana]|uniref:cyclin-dependent kinase n=1 Tax=Sinanodonta woodiana TaxID=1069815 RepID=A0ABD3VKB8_SINWO